MQTQELQSDFLQRAARGLNTALRRHAGDIGRMLGFAALLAVSAQLRFYPPGTVVPVTMQTLVVLLCGYFLRPRLAAAAVALYLAAGFAFAYAAPGFALFAAFAAGQTVTFGYLAGFLAAAVLMSAVCSRFDRLTFGRALAVGLLATAVIFACGVGWLTLTVGSFAAAVQQGLAPFAVWALVKTGVAAALAAAVNPRH